MTYELNHKCIWQHPTTGNQLEITTIVCGEIEKPNIITVRSYMEIDKITGSTLGFGKTLLSASYKIFLAIVLTSLYNPRALALTAVEDMEVGPCV